MRGPWWRVGFAVGLLAGLTAWSLLLRALAIDPSIMLAEDPCPTFWGTTMTLHTASGTQLNKTAATGKTSAYTDSDPVLVVSEHLYEKFRHDGTKFPPSGTRLKFRRGELIRTSEFNACFPAATVDSVTPATGAAAGGTVVTVKGNNFTVGSTVAFGGTAATAVTVVDETTITCTTPAKTAGAVAVAVTTDAGQVSKANAFTFA